MTSFRPRPDPLLPSAFASLPSAGGYDGGCGATTRGRAEHGALDGRSRAAVMPGIFRTGTADMDSDSDDDAREQEMSDVPSPRKPTGGGLWRRLVAQRGPGCFWLDDEPERVRCQVHAVLVQDYAAEIVAARASETRIRVQVAGVNVAVVVNVEKGERGVRVAMRRAFADCFRVGGEPFDRFCKEVCQRVAALRGDV